MGDCIERLRRGVARRFLRPALVFLIAVAGSIGAPAQAAGNAIRLTAQKWDVSLTAEEAGARAGLLSGTFTYQMPTKHNSVCTGRLEQREAVSDSGEGALREALSAGLCVRNCALVVNLGSLGWYETCGNRVVAQGQFQASDPQAVARMLAAQQPLREQQRAAATAARSQRDADAAAATARRDAELAASLAPPPPTTGKTALQLAAMAAQKPVYQGSFGRDAPDAWNTKAFPNPESQRASNLQAWVGQNPLARIDGRTFFDAARLNQKAFAKTLTVRGMDPRKTMLSVVSAGRFKTVSGGGTTYYVLMCSEGATRCISKPQAPIFCSANEAGVFFCFQREHPSGHKLFELKMNDQDGARAWGVLRDGYAEVSGANKWIDALVNSVLSSASQRSKPDDLELARRQNSSSGTTTYSSGGSSSGFYGNCHGGAFYGC